MSPRRLTPPDALPGTSDHILAHHGLDRRYRIHVPRPLPVAAPLVIQLHGGGGNGRGLDRVTHFHARADQERFVVVSPDGFDHYWNDGRVASDIDDAGFMAALIDCVAAWLPIDRQRVYVAGISNGAMMAARLVNQIPDRIAAFAQVAGTAAENALHWWNPDRPVPVLQIHGTDDPIVGYAGGAIPMRGNGPRRRDRGRVLAVEQWAALLTEHNGARGSDPEVEHLAPDIWIRRWRGPTPRSDVEFWRVEGGGHTWPGGAQYLPVTIIGTTTQTFDATAAIWRFVSAHKLP